MDSSDIRKLNAELTAALEKSLPAAFGKPDWVYRDLVPSPPAFLDLLTQIAGEENIEWITRANYPSGLARGQVLISPEGMRRIEREVKQWDEGVVH